MSSAAWSGSVIYRLSYSGVLDSCQPVNADPLAPLFAPLTSLRGIGPAVAALISRAAGGDRVIDLLFHMPESYLDRSARPTIRAAKPGHGGDAGGGGGAARAAGDITATLADRCQGRYRHRRTGVFQVHAGGADAAGRETAGLRQAGRLQRPPDDRASGSCGADRAGGPDSGDRAGLAADRRALAAAGGLGTGPGAGSGAGVSRVARPGAAETGEMAAVRGGAADRAGAGCGRAGPADAGAAGL